MSWIALIGAGIFEMIGVMMINKLYVDKDWKAIVYLAVAFATSFALLSYAMLVLPMGTAYAIWTGIGASGGAILGMIFYGEPKDWKRILCITLIIGAAVGLKLVG